MAQEVKNVKLYYLGGLVNGKALITAQGKSFQLPPVGEYLEVPANIARTIARRNRTPDGQYLFTTDIGSVRRQLEAFKRQQEAPVAAKKFSRAELLEMLENYEEEIQEDFQEGAKAAKKVAKKVEEV